MRVADSQVEHMLRTFTFLPPSEIKHVMQRHAQSPHTRPAQERLAAALTLLVHGEAGLKQAETTTSILYGDDMESLARLSLEETRAVFQQADFIQRLYQPGLTALGKVFGIFLLSTIKAPMIFLYCQMFIYRSVNQNTNSPRPLRT
jgi:tyrosyl-tRNA synthetase